MKRVSLRNRWVSHLVCVAVGATLAGGVWAADDAWKERELSRSLHGRWTMETAHADPAIQRVEAEYRPDGTFQVWQTARDGSVRIVEHGRWWVSGRRLLQEYTWLDGRPVPAGAQQRPEKQVIVRSDQWLVLVLPAGHSFQFRRAAA